MFCRFLMRLGGSGLWDFEVWTKPFPAQTHLNFIWLELLLMLRHESLHVSSRCRPLPSWNELIELEGTKGLDSGWQSHTSCLMNKRTAWRARRNNCLAASCGWRMWWGRCVCGEFLERRRSKAVKTETWTEISYRGTKHAVKISELTAADSWTHCNRNMKRQAAGPKITVETITARQE